MTSLQQARAVAYEIGCRRIGAPQTVPLSGALGYTLAAAATAQATVPTTDTSAMDGWVVSGPGPWRLDGTVTMGALPGPPLAPGRARTVTTGGAVPPGAAAVLRAEHGDLHGDRLLGLAGRPASPGSDIRRAGEEIRVGDLLAPAGTPVTPPVAAAAAVAGLDELTVYPAPRAALVLLGDEVIDSGVPAPGQVRDAFAIALPAILATQGVSITDITRVQDDRDAVRAALTRNDVDVIITTGGTGHGRCDHLVPAVGETGGVIRVRGVDIRPGHPTVLAQLGHVPVIGLPGNPFAAVAALLTIGSPLIAGLIGQPSPSLQRRVSGQDFSGVTRGTRLVAVREVAGELFAVERQGAAMITGLIDADALAVIEPSGALAGQSVQAIPMPWIH
ncbi:MULTISPECIES: molybdopterin molybdotransferase MoeA [unclassified Curtobacterium]|uniref:molybdopterin molybdotransferase MoeA n=1 Tax=unclassified Curtobacterium TaxID=257496 RepID=UPI000D8C4DD1|nr:MULTISPECIES: molybdopterin molybdotransferase MoeA [unclassified Curtobacterium]PYY55894.1 molybdopterin molybdenumtransferase MoeA [Curtobacterium sp. MCSS17_011]WIE79226.1 molybdopterin molybdotransferase MoeA [Curtobacterium sp. MCSS17_016]